MQHARKLLLFSLVSITPCAFAGDVPWSSGGDGAYHAAHRDHRLACQASRDGLVVTPEALAGGTPWRLSLRTVGFGREGATRPLGEATLATTGERLELRRPELTEWFVNDEAGIEHGWTVPTPPAGNGGAALWIALEFRGLFPEVEADGRSARLTDDMGRWILRYRDLHAVDASGRGLPATLVRTADGLGVRVLDAGARYPIVVDPWLAGPVWTAEGGQVDARFGHRVAGGGDVNGDGFDDVVVSSRQYATQQQERGRVVAYLGSPTGPALTSSWSVDGAQPGDHFGEDVANAGDVNGDGYDDVLVGAPGASNGEASEGRAYLYLGSATGLSSTPAWTAESDVAGAEFGQSVAGAGDVNGDGFDDLLVGAWKLDDDQTLEGRAYLFLGSAAGPSPQPDWTVDGDEGNAKLGSCVAGAGDVNGDGFDDVVVGASYAGSGGRALAYYGSPQGLSLAPGWIVDGDQPGAQFGGAVAGVGDVNGDGFDDVVVGAPNHWHLNDPRGRAYLYRGSANGLSTVHNWAVYGKHATRGFGRRVSGAGDVDGDGYDDFVVAARGHQYRGQVFLFRGSAPGPRNLPDWDLVEKRYSVFLCGTVSGAGDVNGDGRDDVLIGMSAYDHGHHDEGLATVYLGVSDCNQNGVDDAEDIANGTSTDCNQNGIPDECDIALGTSADCDQDGVPDECQPDSDGDGTPDACDLGTNYCGPAVPNSSGEPGVMGLSGSVKVVDNDLTLHAEQLPVAQFGYFLVSLHKGFLHHSGGSQGTLCLSGQIGRYTQSVRNTGEFGRFELLIDLTLLPPPILQSVLPGDTWRFQAWFRDNNPNATSNFTDGVSVQFQ